MSRNDLAIVVIDDLLPLKIGYGDIRADDNLGQVKRAGRNRVVF